jgi:hypothetical protein
MSIGLEESDISFGQICSTRPGFTEIGSTQVGYVETIQIWVL